MNLLDKCIEDGYLTKEDLSGDNITYWTVYNDVIEKKRKVNGVWETTRMPNTYKIEQINARKREEDKANKLAQKQYIRNKN